MPVISQNSIIIKIYTIIAILSPLLEMYGITESLHTFTWRLFFVILFIVIHLFLLFTRWHKYNKTSNIFLPFVILICFAFFCNSVMYPGEYSLRFIRFLLLVYFSIYLGQYYFDGKFGFKLYKYIVWIATAVLLTQVVMSLMGQSFNGQIPGLPLRSHYHLEADFSLRYFSIFEEPGYYGMFVIPYLCIRFSQNIINYIEFLFIAIALLLSTSTSNIAVLGFIIMVFILFIKPTNMSVRKRIIIKGSIIIISLLAVFIFLQSDQAQFVMNRLEAGDSAESRLEGYNDYDGRRTVDSVFQFFFGNSLENYPISGYATLFICFGLIGGVVYLFSILLLFIKTSLTGKLILLSFLFVNLGNVEFLGNASSMLIVFPYTYWFIKNKYLFDNNKKCTPVLSKK